jgi:hypothetical protein
MRWMYAAPRFLFVPVSGPGGAGEYHRSLAIARGLARRWPDCTIRFALNRAAPYAAATPYPVTLLDDSPTRSTAAVNDCIRAEQPDVVLFDSAGRLAQYRAARAAGAGVVYLSSRPRTRWKGFRWRRMQLLDQHWIAQPAFLGGCMTWSERAKVRLLGNPEILFLGTLHEPVEPGATAQLQQELGIETGKYVVMCPGGGGVFGDGTDAARIFYAAARELAATRPETFVAVIGQRLFGQLDPQDMPHNVKIIPFLPNGLLLGLIHEAAVAAVNGGSLLLQSLTQHAALVAAPIAGDQPERVRRCAKDGYIMPASLQSPTLVATVQALLQDETARQALRARVAQLNLRNGVDVAMEAIARLLMQTQQHREERR